MNVIFVDTGVWFALLVSRDPNHQRATEWFDALREQVITSDYVVDETLTLLLMRGERSKAIEFGNLVIVGSLAVLHKVTEDQFNRSWILFQKLSGAGLSFTDYTSHIVANDLGVPSVASFDHHFETTGRFLLFP
ncbi:MAG: type II toxin-antitoxin system VapC family toxin [Planctomycetota bacterium]